MSFQYEYRIFHSGIPLDCSWTSCTRPFDCLLRRSAILHLAPGSDRRMLRPQNAKARRGAASLTHSRIAAWWRRGGHRHAHTHPHLTGVRKDRVANRVWTVEHGRGRNTAARCSTLQHAAPNSQVCCPCRSQKPWILEMQRQARDRKVLRSIDGFSALPGSTAIRNPTQRAVKRCRIEEKNSRNSSQLARK